MPLCLCQAEGGNKRGGVEGQYYHLLVRVLLTGKVDNDQTKKSGQHRDERRSRFCNIDNRQLMVKPQGTGRRETPVKNLQHLRRIKDLGIVKFRGILRDKLTAFAGYGAAHGRRGNEDDSREVSGSVAMLFVEEEKESGFARTRCCTILSFFPSVRTSSRYLCQKTASSRMRCYYCDSCRLH